MFTQQLLSVTYYLLCISLSDAVLKLNWSPVHISARRKTEII